MTTTRQVEDLRVVLAMIEAEVIEASDTERGFIAGAIYALENAPAK